LSGVPKDATNLYLTLRSKYEVTVVADCNLGGFNSIKDEDLILLPGLASGRRWTEKVSALVKLRRILSNADIVWAHSSFSILFTRLLKRMIHYRLIVTYHGLPFGPGRKKAISVAAYLTEFVSSKMVDHEVVVISKLDESQLSRIKPRAHCTYIPNASQSVERLQHKPGVSNLAILMTTRDSHQKNLDYAIKLLNKLPNATMDVYGAISSKRKNVLLSKNTAQNTTFHGEVSNARISFSKYNLYLLTSRYEGFSLGLLEAISNGLLVATTNVGGAQEVAFNNPYCTLLTGQVQVDVSKIEELFCRSVEDEGAYDKILDVSARFSYCNWQQACANLLENSSNGV
jgi:glycosyltransferase involved in cell wall biosynthesis